MGRPNMSEKRTTGNTTFPTDHMLLRFRHDCPLVIGKRLSNYLTFSIGGSQTKSHDQNVNLHVMVKTAVDGFVITEKVR